MSGLISKAGGEDPSPENTVRDARAAWQESMERRLDTLRQRLRERNIQHVAALSGSEIYDEQILLKYWGDSILVSWPGLSARSLAREEPCSTFDTAVLLYYLDAADGTPMADRWIGFRELPDGAFYNQAFQGYSGDHIADVFGEAPREYAEACRSLGGEMLPALAPHAFAFQPLPRIRLACALWPGDEDFASRASVLFDGAASHYMPTDGLALLGSGLTRRMIRAADTG
jgi:hypothetical protein